MKSFKLRWDKKKAKSILKKKLKKAIESEAWKDEAADYIITNIRGFTRKQKHAKDSSSLKTISQGHKKNKKKLAKANKTGVLFSPGKSNLTITGQLLASLKKVKHKTKTIVSPTGSRTPYKLASGKSAKSTPTNKELTEYLEEKGYVYMGLSEKMKKQLKKLVTAQFYRSFRK
jgi:hypothetical protein